MFSSIAGRLAGWLGSVVLQDGWPGWLVFSSIAGWLAQAGLCGSIAGRAGLCSVVLQDG